MGWFLRGKVSGCPRCIQQSFIKWFHGDGCSGGSWGGHGEGELFNVAGKMLWNQTCLIPEPVCGCVFAWQRAGRRCLLLYPFNMMLSYFHSQQLWKLVLGFRVPEWPRHDLRPPHAIYLHQKNMQLLAYNPWILYFSDCWAMKLEVVFPT